MITKLYDRNEMQLHMIDALANRVELLEKAYVRQAKEQKEEDEQEQEQVCSYLCRVLDIMMILVFSVSFFVLGVRFLFLPWQS